MVPEFRDLYSASPSSVIGRASMSARIPMIRSEAWGPFKVAITPEWQDST